MQQHALNALVMTIILLGGGTVAAPIARADGAQSPPIIKGPSSGRISQADGASGGVLSWFERAGREYQDSVVEQLSVPTGRGSSAEPRPLAKAPVGSTAPTSPGIVAKLYELFTLGPAAPSPTPEMKTPDASAAADRLTRELEARKREQDRNAEEDRVASEARRARETVDRATLERQKLAEAARLAEEARRNAKPAEVAAGRTSDTQRGPQSKTDQTASQTVTSSAGDKQAIQPPGSGSTRDRTVEIAEAKPSNAQSPSERVPVAQQPQPNTQTAQSTAVGQPDPATKRPTSERPPLPAASATAPKAEASRLAETATKAADKILAKTAKAPRSLSTLADADGSSTGHRSGGKSKRCGAAGRVVETTSIYVVKRGDTLWDISRRYYDKGSAFGRIVRANAETLADPDLIFPCQKVYLPGLHAFLWILSDDGVDPS